MKEPQWGSYSPMGQDEGLLCEHNHQHEPFKFEVACVKFCKMVLADLVFLLQLHSVVRPLAGRPGDGGQLERIQPDLDYFTSRVAVSSRPIFLKAPSISAIVLAS